MRSNGRTASPGRVSPVARACVPVAGTASRPEIIHQPAMAAITTNRPPMAIGVRIEREVGCGDARGATAALDAPSDVIASSSILVNSSAVGRSSASLVSPRAIASRNAGGVAGAESDNEGGAFTTCAYITCCGDPTKGATPASSS